jgi:hypothetical protein
VLKHHLFVFYCLDEPLYEALLPYASDRIRIVLYAKEPVATEFVHYGNSPAFLKMMKLKMDIIQEALACYGFIHFVDGDVVFCKEPTEEYYEPYKDYFNTGRHYMVLRRRLCSDRSTNLVFKGYLILQPLKPLVLPFKGKNLSTFFTIFA